MPSFTTARKRSRMRAVSEELDGGGPFVKRSKTTGRPTRNSAGRKPLPKDFVNPVEVIEDDSASEYEEDKGKGAKKRNWSTRRRRTSPPRALPPAEPLDDISVTNSLETSSSTPSTPQELSLTFHVPPGHIGPIVVKLDLGSMLPQSPNPFASFSIPSVTSTNAMSTHTDRAASRSSSFSTRSMSPARVGFLSLAAELRNHIYRLVFVTALPVNLRSVDNFCRSAALLATCHQVHDEGLEILYGENNFELDRKWRVRAAYFQKEWTEIGYKDCFRFLSTIGPSNISRLRNLTITFEDGVSPFVEDDALIECLKLIARHGQLETLQLGIHGRRMLRATEYRLLDNLRAIKADEVEMVSRPNHNRRYGGWLSRKAANVLGDLDVKLIEKMTRKEKLYRT